MQIFFKHLKKVAKKLFWVLLALLLAFLIWEHKLVWYGMNQGYGQAVILWNAEPVNKILQNEEFPDSLKQKLLLIQEIKRFAVDSLGITDSDNYTTVYDQKGKPILWVVTASAPYELKAYEWQFSFLGKFSYKGHFERYKAEKDSAKLAQQGYDVEIGEVSAWSTLGWFKDPILSSMLNKSEGELANLIIHELTHGTLYVKDSVDFNENLASFVGDKGALAFLKYKFGEQHDVYKSYNFSKHDVSLFYEYILKETQRLDSLYKNPEFQAIQDTSDKNKLKQKLINEIIMGLADLPFQGKKYDKNKLVKWQPNNAFFIDYIRYRAKQDIFEQELQNKFQGNLKAYITYLKETYPSL